MKRIFSKIFKFLKPEPAQVVLLTVIIGVFGVAFFRWKNDSGNFKEIEIEYQTAFSSDRQKQFQQQREDLRLGESDENLLFAERVKEGAAISLGLSIMTLNARLVERRNFTTVTDLMAAFEKSPMLPPHTSVATPQGANPQYGICVTKRGSYFIRYRAQPLGFEILAVGMRGLADGAAFIMRVPDGKGAEINYQNDASDENLRSFAGNFATLYVSPRNLEAYIPPPFAEANIFIQSGWTAEPLRNNELSPDKLAQLRQFLENTPK